MQTGLKGWVGYEIRAEEYFLVVQGDCDLFLVDVAIILPATKSQNSSSRPRRNRIDRAMRLTAQSGAGLNDRLLLCGKLGYGTCSLVCGCWVQQ